MGKNYKESKTDISTASEPNYAETYTVKDYLKWTFDGLYEIIKGKVFKMSPAPTSSHQRINFKLSFEFGVKEYWIVFPGQNAINIFSLVDGKFELHKTFENEEMLQSPLFEQLHFKVSEVF